MSLIKFDPVFESFPLAEWNDFLQAPRIKHVMPAVDIKEEKGEYLIKADLPGINPKDIEVSIDNDLLTIKGKRESETKEASEGYSRVERHQGLFERRFILPDADSDKIHAAYKRGVLELVVPRKQAEPEQKRIKIDINES